jgi:hypothetical protein
LEQESNLDRPEAEEISPEVSLEEENVSKTYTEEEWRTFQGTKDREIGIERTARQHAERELALLKEDHDSTIKRIDELETEIARKEDAAFEGDTEGLSAAKLRREATRIKRDAETKLRDIERREKQLGVVMRQGAITEISQKYGISAKLLEHTKSYQEAEKLAQAIKDEFGKTPTKVGEVPRPSRGTSDATGRRTFTQDQIANMSSEQYREYEKDILEAWRQNKIQ